MWTTQNLYAKVIILYVFILYIYPFYITADGIFSYKEENDYYGEPYITNLKAYDDGTVVLRIVNNTDESYDMFSLRIIYLNRTVIKKDIKLGEHFDYYGSILNYELIRINQILVIHEDNINLTHYNVLVMIIDFDGNILDRTNIKLIQLPLSLTLNINREKGFIIYDDITKYAAAHAGDLTTSIVSWQQYGIEPNGKFIKLTKWYQLNSNHDIMIPTVNEGYAYLYMLTSPNDGLANDLLIAAVLINYNKSESSTVLLYHNHLQNKTFFDTSLFCDIEYVGVGQYCTLSNFEYNISFPILKVNFLSSGSVVSFNNVNLRLGLFDESFSLKNLPYGSFIMLAWNPFTIHVNFFDENGTSSSGSIEIQKSDVNLILPNNTLLIRQDEPGNNTWVLKVINLPKFTNRNIEYGNTNINSTFPKINDSLKFSDITNISINFYDPVKLSDSKLSIYYQLNDQKILRQSTSCTGLTAAQCMLENNDKRVTVRVLNSVLSKSGGNYSIKVDNNFVKNKVYEEPLLGIKEKVWKFKIEDSKIQYPIISSISGLLRLNEEGTDKIDRSKSNDERNKFFNALLGELADVILIPRERLSKDSKEQFNPDSKDKKLLIFSIKISEVEKRDEKDANTTIYPVSRDFL